MQLFNRILLVDDDSASNYLSQVLLTDLDAAKEIEVAEDGLVALEIMKEKECPDIIFLDIRMPRMDGFEFLEDLGKLNVCKKAKIVMLSSSVRLEDKKKAFSYECVLAYVEKPITVDMIERVAKEYYNHNV